MRPIDQAADDIPTTQFQTNTGMRPLFSRVIEDSMRARLASPNWIDVVVPMKGQPRKRRRFIVFRRKVATARWRIVCAIAALRGEWPDGD
jgi:hypothetical protein